jgi:hypothetical protein
LLKNASEVTLVPKNIFSLQILNFVQSFVECKVSLADGMSIIHFPCPQKYCKNPEPRFFSQLSSSLLGGVESMQMPVV